MSIKAYKGLVVPFPCQKSWKWMLIENIPGCNNIHSEREDICRHVDCHDCVYFNTEARAEYYKSRFPEIPKLTVEIFDRSDCPEWAQWAAVDNDGKAYWYSKKPEPKVNQWYRCAQNPGRYQQIENSTRTKFDALDWQNSLIERPAKCICNSCKHYEPKDSPDREMIPVYEFDWYTQWKYSQREDKYYYIEDIRKNRARELKTGELVNELPADVIVVSPADPDPAVLIATAVQHVLTGNYYVIQKVEEDGGRIYVKDMDWEKSEFYKNFIDKWGRPVCYFTKATED